VVVVAAVPPGVAEVAAVEVVVPAAGAAAVRPAAAD